MSAQDTEFYNKTAAIFDQNSAPLVMGILNITPDSFYDGGRYFSAEKWLARAREMMAEGVDIIDIGAYSTRPGAENISVQEEIDRLIPAIRSIRKEHPRVLLSADTFRAPVAHEAIAAGANIINDIGGGSLDPDMWETVCSLQVPYVLMHIQGDPQTMQKAPHYSNVTEELICFFEEKLNYFKKRNFNQLIIDPGFGFGKTVEHNYELLKNLDRFSHLPAPVLIGISRKSMVYKPLNINKEHSLTGTIALNMIGLQKGAKILRVHDVKEAVQVRDIHQLLNRK